MYFQITTRCNMECPHCCYDCTAEGIDMSVETFRNALSWNIEMYENEFELILGGGEPTLHPNFKEFLMDALMYSGVPYVITNGSNKEISLGLAKLNNLMGERRVAVLSWDVYHEKKMVDDKVFEAFSRQKSLRDVGDHEICTGRAIEYAIGGAVGCVCSTLFLKPDGFVKFCGCEDAPIIGSVNSPAELSKLTSTVEYYRDNLDLIDEDYYCPEICCYQNVIGTIKEGGEYKRLKNQTKPLNK